MSEEQVPKVPNVVTIDLDDITYTINDKEYVDEGAALGVMLASNQLFYNQKIYVNCSDVFAWGCSDAEDYVDDQLLTLFKMFNKDRSWGTAMWCMIQRKERPQKPVEDAIRKEGIWDFDAFIAEHGLRANVYDGTSMIAARRKFELANAWLVEQGQEPVEFEVGWWKHAWTPFEKANPGWYNDEYKEEVKRRCNEWYLANGWEFLAK
ncbi:predicted ORF [Xanthomonas phage XacN1]|nr:predicted ORF [Xanthomonas phage XacN1]